MKINSCSVRKPVQSRSKNTKSVLLVAGLSLISKDGYYKINSKDIAREAGVSIGSFYAYFSDKKELFLELVKEYKTRSTHSMECSDEVEDIDPRESIKNFILNKISIASEYPYEFHRELHYQRIREKEVDALYNEYKNNEIKYFENILLYLNADLEVDNVLTSAKLLFNIYEEIIVSILETNDEEERSVLLEEYVNLLSGYLLNRDK